MSRLQWLDVLKSNEKATQRLDHILNHTPTTADGETVFATVEDAAEVYTILFMAFCGSDPLADLVGHMDGEKDRAITRAALRQITTETDDGFETGPVKVDGKLIIAADWT